MTTTIAISGKGGSGKTTLAAMIIRLLCGKARKGVLAVDGDPNSCLGLTMGVEPGPIIAQIREKAAQKQPSASGTDRVRSFEYGIQQAITEAEGFDLLTMGHPEGPGCYCAANNLLRNFLDKLSSAYDFVVTDNEAGMEHLSRRTTNKVDLLCIVAEPTSIGVVTAKRIFKLAEQLPISVKHIGMIWNKAESSKELDGPDVFGYVPYDQAVSNASMQGESIFDIDQNSPAFAAVQRILEQKLFK
ncbi:MAG: ATP-binding protein [Planctomycetota bacterium]|jgi:CO dehydrogenase maturation factor